MTVRTNRITGAPVLFAPERAARPHAFGGAENDGRCPFCPGHESDTPPTLAEHGQPWRIRVFANKYPPAAGAEVVVESAAHEATFHGLEQPEEVVRMWIDRYAAHRDAPAVALFKNHGRAAGSSIAHIHSQVVPLPFVPPRLQSEGEAFAHAGRCMLCERSDDVEIAQTSAFRWVAPYASALPYQQWLIPKRHFARLDQLQDSEIAELARLLQRASAAMLRIGEAYNWCFIDFRHHPAGHLYVDLFPRLTTLAGLELGAGTFVEIIDPAAAAVRLRG